MKSVHGNKDDSEKKRRKRGEGGEHGGDDEGEGERTRNQPKKKARVAPGRKPLVDYLDDFGNIRSDVDLKLQPGALTYTGSVSELRRKLEMDQARWEEEKRGKRKRDIVVTHGEAGREEEGEEEEGEKDEEEEEGQGEREGGDGGMKKSRKDGRAEGEREGKQGGREEVEERARKHDRDVQAECIAPPPVPRAVSVSVLPLD
uniref:Uncharacterized protein n=1 Tax=Palpitomonas bilix TaxID=652834 RepID=A0A7S3CVT6_9EUKA|mmetsp:Transcript_11311/g.29881  ORF Transcript_11311/g.29881 Transcript_11311/m.29881 type:complete len:202 (+) Transcript_11311:257-862(+)